MLDRSPFQWPVLLSSQVFQVLIVVISQIIVAQATLDGAKKELSFVRRKDKAHDQLVKRLQEKHASETTKSFQ